MKTHNNETHNIEIRIDVFATLLAKINEWVVEAAYHNNWDLERRCRELYDSFSSHFTKIADEEYAKILLTSEQSVFLNYLLINSIYQQKFEF